jgi:uncharacterized membrane protein YgaE (UPF0421/DUF939 family)
MISFKKNRLNDISDTTLLAYRVLIACIIGIMVCFVIFTLTGHDEFRDRVYWIVIAVVSVAASTSTNVIYSRAKAIVLFSILGTTVGSLIFYMIHKFLPDNILYVSIVCALAMTFYIYTVYMNYAKSVFFVHIYLVMFFGLFSAWSTDLFFVRVISITVGTICIVTLTFLTKTTKSKKMFFDELQEIYDSYSSIISTTDNNLRHSEVVSLGDRVAKLNEMLINAKFEFTTRQRYYRYKKIILLMEHLLINLQSYISLYDQQEKHNNDLYEELVVFTNDQIQENFKKLTIKYDRILLQTTL